MGVIRIHVNRVNRSMRGTMQIGYELKSVTASLRVTYSRPVLRTGAFPLTYARRMQRNDRNSMQMEECSYCRYNGTTGGSLTNCSLAVDRQILSAIEISP